MNREQVVVVKVDKSMGFFGIYKEAYRITVSWNKILSQISLAMLLPLTILSLSEIPISNFIRKKTYHRHDDKTRWMVCSIINRFVYMIFVLGLSIFSASSVAYVVACFYTSKDITFKKAVGVFPKVWGRLMITFLWWFVVVLVYTTVAALLYFWFFTSQNGFEVDIPKVKNLLVISVISVPFFAGLVYLILVWSITTVISVLEMDYGRKALMKSMKLIWGKTVVSYGIFLVLGIAFVGLGSTFVLLMVYKKMGNVAGKVLIGIACYFMTIVLIHFTLVIQAVIYFVCKSYHNEDIANIALHLQGSRASSDREKDATLEPASLV
ncbi:hypothetical protein MKX03_028929 [Papaver bracteatum]|nr:hypothetical protein MKX03_028929 [Papaver bracteatum]